MSASQTKTAADPSSAATTELAKAYEPAAVEDRLYAEWIERDYFHADASSDKPPFSIVIPPPNVTGVLTMGHVLNNTLQDILCRRARMQGHEVLWLPGTDHAGLATQAAVEKALRKPDDLPPTVKATLESFKLGKDERPTRHALGRERMLELIWAWTKDRGGVIIQQLKKLGASCDWARERFTLDDDYLRAVQQAFVDLYDRGYMYRGLRMVNWCPASHTAISDEEVIPTPQKSKLYTMRYEIAEEPGRFVEIATTRPETLMGDSGVAVHPKDERYADLIGKHAVRPFPKANIPIVADEYIDIEFGTGVLKVTPAHDKADFEIGQRHKLEIIDVITNDGKINCPDCPELHGMERFAARKKAAEMLAEMDQLVKEEDYENNVGFSERGKVPIEPKLSKQWFLKYPKVEESIQVVRDNLINFHPAHWEKTYDHWLENIQDWCVSRQVWWGHRIPVWYKGEPDEHGDYPEVKASIESPGEGWIQDPDAMDTWASSWLWAYATMDDATRKKFYPTSVLVTGPDIIFLWVARMIIAGLEFTPGKSKKVADNIAFSDVYFTGLIRDGKGRKMSKSLGNSPDPLDLIAKYGADGLRFGLMRIAPQGSDIRFDEKAIEEGRNFCNKLWNACRFRAMQGPIEANANPSAHQLTAFATGILHQLDETIVAVNRALDAYEFNNAAAALYDFVWKDFCSRFLESAKADFNNESSQTRAGTLAAFDYCISRVLRMLHPYAPFITEELWIGLGYGTETIQFEAWPTIDKLKKAPQAHAQAQAIYETVDAGRALRGEFNIASNKKVAFKLKLGKDAKLTETESGILSSLLNAETLEEVKRAPSKTPMIFCPLGELYLPLEGLVDPEAEKQRLEKELAKVAKDTEVTDKKLSNKQVIEKAPADKVAEWRALADDLKTKKKRLEQQLKNLE